MSYYLIRLGEGSKYVKEAQKEGFIAIGWNEVPDLRTKIKSKKDEGATEDNNFEAIKREIRRDGVSSASLENRGK